MTKSISVISFTTILVFALLAFAGTAFAGKPASCATIQGGTIEDSAGNPIQTGYDQFGYNYQSHMFNGTYDSSDRTIDGTYWGSTGDYVDDSLIMKWSDAWLSNVDCNGDNKLDRGRLRLRWKRNARCALHILRENRLDGSWKSSLGAIHYHSRGV